MEISYYFECFNHTANFDPECLKIDVVIAEFSFKMPFDDDYNDIDSLNAIRLLKIIEPLLTQSFGVMEINISTTKIRKGSVIIVQELRPIRHPVSKIKSLLNNEKNVCNEFLDETKGLCWFGNAKKIFQENGFEFVGVRIVDEPVMTTATPTTSKTVVSTFCPTKPEDSRYTRKSPKFFIRPIRSTQRFSMRTTFSINKENSSPVKKTDSKFKFKIFSTRIISTESIQYNCGEIIGPDSHKDIKTTTSMISQPYTFTTWTPLSTTSSIPPSCPLRCN